MGFLEFDFADVWHRLKLFDRSCTGTTLKVTGKPHSVPRTRALRWFPTAALEVWTVVGRHFEGHRPKQHIASLTRICLFTENEHEEKTHTLERGENMTLLTSYRQPYLRQLHICTGHYQIMGDPFTNLLVRSWLTYSLPDHITGSRVSLPSLSVLFSPMPFYYHTLHYPYFSPATPCSHFVLLS